MSAETHQWVKAEENFHKWIENPVSYERNEDSEIRKSIHLYFIKKSKDRYTTLTRQILRDIFTFDIALQADGEPAEYQYAFLEDKKPDLRYTKENEPAYTPELNLHILSGFVKDDMRIVKKFYQQEFIKVARLILTNNGTIDDARDIFQDALIILLDKYKWGKLDLSCSLGTYIYSISRNLWYTCLRKLKKENEFIELEQFRIADVSTDYYEEQPENYDSVYNAIEKLGNRCRQILELFYFEKCSWETIASALGYSSAASARNQKYKCLEKIREQL